MSKNLLYFNRSLLLTRSLLRKRYLCTSPSLWQQSAQVTERSHYVEVSEDKRRLTLQCDGGDQLKRRFLGMWLRHNCQCPVCTSVHTGQTIVDPKLLVKNLQVESASISGDQLNVEWSVSGSTVHSGYFPLDWLRDHDYSNPEQNRNNKPLVAKELPVLSYNDIMESDEGLYQWLLHLNQYGVCLLKNIPNTETEIKKVANRIGPVYNTIYGETFRVETSPNPLNQAYTSDSLLLHMDQGFYETPPGLQLLHAVRFDECVEGGESILLDTYPVVEEMRRTHPKQFDTLTRVPVPLKRHQYSETRNVDYLYSRKTIVLDDQGEIIGINWYPQIQDSLRLPESELEEFYDAFTLLAKMLEDSKLKLVHRLLPGEAITFHNRRYLHSRTAFKQNGGLRLLIGTYSSLDDFRSRFYTLRKLLGKTDIPSVMLNGCGYNK